ncbi:unnamed protein product [Caenorhabditis brenneri]
MTQAFNWTLIQKTCPEFNLNCWDVIFAFVAFIGSVINFVLMFYFKKVSKTAVYIPNLCGYDYFICCLYIWKYLLPVIAMYFQCDALAELRINFSWTAETFDDYLEIILGILIFCIIFEKFLWTFSSRVRHTWRCFIVGNCKFWLLMGLTVYAVLAAFTHNWNLLQLSDVPFCDVTLLPIPIKQPFFRFIQLYLIPLISDLLIGLIFILTIITLIRIPRIGKGDKPVEQKEEEVNLENQEENKSGVDNNAKIKRTIICMAIICFIFLVRASIWHMLIKPNSIHISSRGRSSKIMKNWIFDCCTMVISATRILVYYVVCRMNFVAEYPASGVLK